VHVTTKTATPTKVDSKLSDAHLELLKRREKKGNATKAQSLEQSAVRLHKRLYLASTGQNSTLFMLLSSKRR
jgi:hypothetical protein